MANVDMVMKAFPHGKGKMGALALLWFVAALLIDSGVLLSYV